MEVLNKIAMKNLSYRRILVTNDGSTLAKSAFPHAISLALAAKAEVLLLQVINSVAQELEAMSDPAMGMNPPVVSYGNIAIELVKENQQKAILQMEKIKTEFLKAGIPKVTTYIMEGLAQDVIIDIARKKHCDLIVMSTHGRSGLGRVMLGSVTDHVIRHASCPILVVRPGKEKRG